MAHIYGKLGESALQKSLGKRENVLWGVFMVAMFVALGMGILIGLMVLKVATVRYFTIAAIIGVFLFVRYWTRSHKSFFEEKLQEARAWQRGYEGERVIGELLGKELSDKFHVFNDVRFPGKVANIDHIVVGPSGIFVLNTKNWRGTVAWDEDGTTLLLNGEPEKKGAANAVLADAIDVHDKLKTLTNREFFIKPILVFPLAKVSPKLDTKVELQQDNYLIDKRLNYIDKRTALAESDVKMVVDALKALFRSDLS